MARRKNDVRWGGAIAWASRAAVGALVIGVGLGAALGYGPLARRVGAMRAAQVRAVVHWPLLAGKEQADATDASATWMPAGERRALEQMVQFVVTPDPFDRASLEEARRALEATGWFEDGLTLRRAPGGEVDVSGVWRVPTAAVRSGGVDRLVSRDGRLLRLDYPAGGAGGLRVVIGAWATPPDDESGSPAYGETWKGGDVQAALRLLDLLRSSPAWTHVAGVDVADFMKSGRLAIITAGGSRLVWGSPPGSPAPGEQPDSVKLARLTNLLNSPDWVRAGRPSADLYTPYVMIDASHRGG